MLKRTIIFSLLATVFFTGCEKFNKDIDLIAENQQYELADVANKTQVKFIHAFAGNTPTLASAPATTQGPQVFLYMNDKRLNGTALSYNGVWPPNSGGYGLEDPGNQSLRVVMARLQFGVSGPPAPIAGDTLINTMYNFEAGKKYSIFLVDTPPTMRTLILQDIFPDAATTEYSLRFVNLTNNPTDVYDVYSRRNGSLIFSGVAHKQVRDFIKLTVPAVQDTFDFRAAGSATNLFFTNFQPIAQRAYTIYTRGKTGNTSKPTGATFVTNK